MTEEMAAHRKKYARVGGFLILFCLSLLIFPAFAVYGYVSFFKNLALLSGNISVLALMAFHLLMDTLLMLFATFVGWALVKVKPWAAAAAKVFLVVQLVVPCLQVTLSLFIAFFLNLPMVMAVEKFTNLLRPIVYFIVWFLYFLFSRRVKATYGR